MAKIAVPVTQPELMAIVPASPQRRVIALELHAPAGVGNSDFCYTPQLGNRLWLYNIDIWAYCADPPALLGGFFWLMYGTGVPVSDDDVATKWNHIIPLYCSPKPAFRWFECGDFHRRFTMAKLFTTNELRFAVAINNLTVQQWECTVAFEVAEG